MLVWLLLVGKLSRVNVATLLSRPGIGVPPEVRVADTGVFRRSLIESAQYCGVCTVM